MKKESHAAADASVHAELLGAVSVSDAELAQACGVAVGWVHERVEAGVLQVDAQGGRWRFDSITLTRARRIADLESTYDADPQLAALTVDLIEEVGRLRRRLALIQPGDVHDA